MRESSKPKPSRLANALLILLAVPIVGVLMGGAYSLPAIKLTHGRDPWLTLLLSFGLGITVFGGGSLGQAPPMHLVGAWAASLVLLLLARWSYGNLGHNLERFGIVHVAALFLTAAVSVAAYVRTRGH